MSFYLVLPSDASFQLYPGNTPHHFKITLDEAIHLPVEENWEVSLVEVSYVNAMTIFNNNESILLRRLVYAVLKTPSFLTLPYIASDQATGIVQVDNFYWSVTNGMIENAIPRKEYHNLFKIRYDKTKNRFQFIAYPPYVQIQLPEAYLAQLGFRSMEQLNNWSTFGTLKRDVDTTDPYEAVHPPADGFIRINTHHPLQARIYKRWYHWRTDRAVPRSGYYNSMDDLIGEINAQVKSNLAVFEFNARDNRVHFSLTPGTSLTLHNGMQNVLGFSQTRHVHSAVGERAPSLRASVYSLYIYCNIITDQRVGHVKVPLLRSIPLLPANPGHPVTVSLDKRRYCPLNTNLIHTIEIAMHNDSGGVIKFEEGKTLLLLHFRAGSR